MGVTGIIASAARSQLYVHFVVGVIYEHSSKQVFNSSVKLL